MNTNPKIALLAVSASLAVIGSSSAQTVVYDNLGTAATAGYSDLNANNPIFGDALTLSQGGQLSTVGVSLYNSTTGGNTGSILTGSMVLNFYNNTTPYAGGSLSGSDPLLGTATVSWDFTGSGGLPAGSYTTGNFNLSALNINLPQNIFVTQQFTETSGTSLRNGVVLFSNPTVGSSPANVYLDSAATPEGLYTFSGGNPNQFGYHIEITVAPEPSVFALAGLGAAAAFVIRRRKSS